MARHAYWRALRAGYRLTGLCAAKALNLAAHLMMTNLGGASLYGDFALVLVPVSILTFAGHARHPVQTSACR